MSENTNMTRRSFVTGAATGAAALAGAAALTSTALADEEEPKGEDWDDWDDDRYDHIWEPEQIETIPAGDASGIAWDIETEVLCCGYGATGASAAIMAADAGAQVLIIEKDTLPGGSMARCGGGLAGAGTSMQKDLGIEDSVDDFYDWLKTCLANNCPDDIVRVYAEQAGKNIDWVNELNIQYNGEPAFVSQFTDTYFNGISTTGTDYALFGVNPEDVPPRSHWVWIGENVEGVGFAGPELFDPLYKAINDRPDQISVMFQTALQTLIQDPSGQIIGATAIDAEGNKLNIKAKKGVVLGTGGFPYGYDMMFAYAPKILNYRSFMNPNCTGDGIRAAQMVGAALMNMTDFQPIEAAYEGVAGTTKDQVIGRCKYNSKWNDVFAMWDISEDDPSCILEYGSTFAETHGGVVIDVNAQVHNVMGNPIPRLFASGCDTGTNVYGAPAHYPGCGTYVGFAMVFGRIAGTNAAALDNWDEA